MVKKSLLKFTQKQLERKLDKEGPRFIGDVLVELDDLLERAPVDVYQNPRVLHARKVVEDLFHYSLAKHIDDESRELRKQYCITYMGILINHGLPPELIESQKPKVRHYWVNDLKGG